MVEVPEVADVQTNSPEKAEKPKNEKIKLDVPEGGYTEVPEEYDANKHQPLKKKEFADPRTYHHWKISELKKMADSHQKQIDLLNKFGTDPESVRKAKALVRQAKSLSTLIEGLPEGVTAHEVLGDLADQLAALQRS